MREKAHARERARGRFDDGRIHTTKNFTPPVPKQRRERPVVASAWRFRPEKKKYQQLTLSPWPDGRAKKVLQFSAFSPRLRWRLGEKLFPQPKILLSFFFLPVRFAFDAQGAAPPPLVTCRLWVTYEGGRESPLEPRLQFVGTLGRAPLQSALVIGLL